MARSLLQRLYQESEVLAVSSGGRQAYLCCSCANNYWASRVPTFPASHLPPRPCTAPMSIAASRCSPILKFPSELRGRDNVALLLLRRCRFRSRVPQTLPLVSIRLCQPHLALPAGADDHMTHGVFFRLCSLVSRSTFFN
jgi:hypothetical protein